MRETKYALRQKSHDRLDQWGESPHFTLFWGIVSLIVARLHAEVGRQP
jgi:hypothetical protein